MKRVKKVLLISFMLVSVLMYTTGAADAPGSATDPVVTKSYVDQKISEALAAASTTTAPVQTTDQISTDDLMLKIDFAVSKKLSEMNITGTGDATVTAAGSTFKVIEVLKGQKLIATGDGPEIILRAGNCIAISPTDSLADVTTGNAILNGQAVSLNHLIILPRVGRGVEVTKDAWFMVRGDYVIN